MHWSTWKWPPKAHEVFLGPTELRTGLDFGNAPVPLTLVVAPESISENGGTAQGTVLLPRALPSDLEVLLTSSDTLEATVPESGDDPRRRDDGHVYHRGGRRRIRRRPENGDHHSFRRG